MVPNTWLAAAPGLDTRHRRPRVNLASSCRASAQADSAIGPAHRHASRARIALAGPPRGRRGLRESRGPLLSVRLEQALQLLRRLLCRLDELRLVVLHRVLRLELPLIVLLEQGHGAIG